MNLLNDCWAKSLHHKKIDQNDTVCFWSREFQSMIHIFKLGMRKCNCRKITIKQKITRGGWKGIPCEDYIKTKGQGTKYKTK
jgi:hypothetical protein